MGGIRIQCQLIGPQKCVRVLDIPDDVTFKDLHTCMKLSFGLTDEKAHAFSAGELNVPVSTDPDEEKQDRRESDLCPGNLFRAGEPISYFFESDEYSYEIEIRKKQMKPSFRKTYVVPVEASSVPPGSAFTEGSAGKRRAGETILSRLKTVFQDFVPDRDGVSYPDLDSLFQDSMDRIDEMMREKGLDMQSFFDKMDREAEGHPSLPAPPAAGDTRGELYENFSDLKKWADSHQDGSIPAAVGEKNLLDLVSRLDSLGLYDYCKYLNLLDKLSLSDSEKAQAIRSTYEDSPEVLLYPLSDEETEEILALAAGSGDEGSCRAKSATTYVMMGLAYFSSEDETLYFASDLFEVLEKLSPAGIRKVRKQIEAFDADFKILIRHYGVLEIDTVHKFLRDIFSEKLSPRRCNRLIYWRHSLLGNIVTFSDDRTHQQYCAEKGLDLGRIMNERYINDLIMPYAEISPYELDQWRRSGDYLNVFAGWSYLYGFLAYNGGMQQEEAREHCDAIYMEVRNGANLGECMEMLGAGNGTNTEMAVRMLIWEVCLHFLAGTSLPALKGEKPAAACRNPAYGMCPSAMFAQDAVREEDIGRLTHIENMPERIQLEIGARLFTLEESDLPSLRKLKRRFSDNADINYLLATAYHRLGQFEDAISCLERVDRLLEGRDPSIARIIEMCRQGHSLRLVSIRSDGFVFL